MPRPRVKVAQSPTKGAPGDTSVTIRVKRSGKPATSYTKRVSKGHATAVKRAVKVEEFWRRFIKGKR